MDNKLMQSPANWMFDKSLLAEAARISASVEDQAIFRSGSQATTPSNESDPFWYESKVKPAGNLFDDDTNFDPQLPVVRRNHTTAAASNSANGNFFQSEIQLERSSVDLDPADILKRIDGLMPKHIFRSSASEVEKTVSQIILGQNYILEPFKSLDAKTGLLDEAIKWKEEGTIITIILFLKSTLSWKLFSRVIIDRPVAVNHYISYLRQMDENAQLMDFLAMVGRHDEASIIKYALSTQTQDPTAKIRNLGACYKSHFQDAFTEPTKSYSTLLQEQISLLELQKKIEEQDVKLEAEGKHLIMREFPRVASVVGTSLTATLYYCCMYHFNSQPGDLASPHRIRDIFQISEKQFMWTALRALARVRHWEALPLMFHSKSWLGKARMRCCIGFDRVVEILAKAKAPHEEVEKYLQLVDDLDVRLELAKKFQLHESVIQCCIGLRDRVALCGYLSQIPKNSLAFSSAKSALAASSMKWKN